MKYHLIIVGFDHVVSDKYIQTVQTAFKKKYLNGYSIIDLKSSEKDLMRRIDKLNFKPTNICLLKKQITKNNWANEQEFSKYIEDIKNKNGEVKVYIATELKAHESYLEYCIKNSIPALIEKPVLAPLKSGYFLPEDISKKMKSLENLSKNNKKDYSVMTLSRYHKVYNDFLIEDIKNKMLEFSAPLTSIHFRTSGGVLNLLDEYLDRTDHSYKEGYGMIMHGGYHYIDLVYQFLELNKIIFPKDELLVELVSYSATPHDQYIRFPLKLNKHFGEEKNKALFNKRDRSKIGETDICTIFRLINKKTNTIVTLGTISLEQSTPSFRNWKKIPNDVYNKNGRLSFVDIELQLSSLYSINVQCYDTPDIISSIDQKIRAKARVLKRSNVNFLKKGKYTEEKTFKGFFHSDSNRKLLQKWLENEESKSLFHMHVGVMDFVKALSLSKKEPGKTFVFDLNKIS